MTTPTGTYFTCDAVPGWLSKGTDANGVVWKMTGLTGWDEPPDSREIYTSRTGDGSFDAPVFDDSRVITWMGLLQAPDRPTRQACKLILGQLAAALKAGADLVGNDEDGPKTVHAKRSPGWKIAPFGPYGLQYQAVVKCPDPYKYGPAQTSMTGLPAPGSGGLAFPLFDPATRTLQRTNLCTNPSFETGTAGWATSAGTLARDTTVAYVGSSSGKYSGATVGGACYLSPGAPIGAGVPVTVSCWVQGTGSVQMVLSNQSGIFASGPVVTLTGAWQRITLTGTTPAGTTSVTPQFYPQHTGDVVWIDAVLLEQSAAVGTYFDGSTPDTSADVYAWTGTANGSTSQQYAITYPGVLNFGTPGDPGQVTLANPGTADAWPTFTITGPVLGGVVITDVASGRQIVYTGDVPSSGVLLIIDAAAGRATLNGADRSGLLTVKQWFPIPANTGTAPPSSAIPLVNAQLVQLDAESAEITSPTLTGLGTVGSAAGPSSGFTVQFSTLGAPNQAGVLTATVNPTYQ